MAKDQSEKHIGEMMHKEAETFRVSHERQRFREYERQEREEMIALGLGDTDDSYVNDSDEEELELLREPVITDEEEEFVMNNKAITMYGEIAVFGLDDKTKEVFTKDTFICDTGASCHLTNSLEGMNNITKYDGQIKIGNGKPLQALRMGDKHVVAIQKDGTTQDLI